MGGTDVGWRLAGCALAWLLGAALHLHEEVLMPAWIYSSACLVGLLCFGLAWRWPRIGWLALLGALIVGAGASGWHASVRLSDRLPPQVEGQDLQLEGVVASLPQLSSAGLRFRFEVEKALWQGQPVQVPPLLSLGWYSGFHEDAELSQPQRALRAGQRWRFTVRLRQPHGNVNPDGFDYELYLFEQGVRATGYVRASDKTPPELLDERVGYLVDRLRQHVRDAINATVSDGRAAGVLAALAIGDQAAIERDDWQLFRDTGVAHLMSISGLHVTMFAWLAGALVMLLWRRSGRAMLCWPAASAGRIGGVLAAAAYALFSGWGVPAQRTLWMLATVALLQLAGRRWPWPLGLLAAAVVVSALDPWALLQPGFWLSFMAVGLLMASTPAHATHTAPPAGHADGALRCWLTRLKAHSAAGLRTQLIATLGLTPLTLVFFQQVSVVGFAANLVAIPLVTLVVTPLALLGALAAPLWTVGAQVVQILVAGLAILQSGPLAVWTVAVAPWWAQAAGLVGAVLLVLPLPWRLRLLAVPLVLPLLLPPRETPAPGRFELVAVDVGQGTSVLLRTHAHLLVFDTGPQYSRDSDAGQRVLLPLLRARGETRIDRLVLSHRDADHVGGAAALLQGLPVGDVLSSLEPGHRLLAMGAPAIRCAAGQAWDWDGVHFEILHPQAADYQRKLKSNAMSCVLRVSALQASALLTGDIEREQEAALVASLGAALQSDILVVPHHGSRTSSTAAFLDAVQPRVAVIQAGYRNRFGHPVAQVLNRLAERQVLVSSSASCGAWTWDGNGPGVCQRGRDRRYWQHHDP
ncbi:MAG TPA: DNA internalization-related competence protein ComEC/Rec2 [Rhizobacter sp.]|nr:DNA internalization-related competence protein ComEC/Rec2 [Rhizobacter sp.]